MISGAVKQNPGAAAYTLKDIEFSTAKWLTGARDRDGRRKERTPKQQQPVAAAASAPVNSQ